MPRVIGVQICLGQHTQTEACTHKLTHTHTHTCVEICTHKQPTPNKGHSLVRDPARLRDRQSRGWKKKLEAEKSGTMQNSRHLLPLYLCFTVCDCLSACLSVCLPVYTVKKHLFFLQWILTVNYSNYTLQRMMFNYLEHYNKLLCISISGASEVTVTQVKWYITRIYCNKGIAPCSDWAKQFCSFANKVRTPACQKANSVPAVLTW